MNKICDSYWQYGGQIPEEQREFMSTEEIEFFAEYRRIIDN